MVVAGGMVYGWEVVSQVAETLPWIGAAFLLLNDLVDVVNTKFELEVHSLFSTLEGVAEVCFASRVVILGRETVFRARPASLAVATKAPFSCDRAGPSLIFPTGVTESAKNLGLPAVTGQFRQD